MSNHFQYYRASVDNLLSHSNVRVVLRLDVRRYFITQTTRVRIFFSINVRHTGDGEALCDGGTSSTGSSTRYRFRIWCAEMCRRTKDFARVYYSIPRGVFPRQPRRFHHARARTQRAKTIILHTRESADVISEILARTIIIRSRTGFYEIRIGKYDCFFFFFSNELIDKNPSISQRYIRLLFIITDDYFVHSGIVGTTWVGRRLSYRRCHRRL